MKLSAILQQENQPAFAIRRHYAESLLEYLDRDILTDGLHL